MVAAGPQLRHCCSASFCSAEPRDTRSFPSVTHARTNPNQSLTQRKSRSLRMRKMSCRVLQAERSLPGWAQQRSLSCSRTSRVGACPQTRNLPPNGPSTMPLPSARRPTSKPSRCPCAPSVWDARCTGSTIDEARAAQTCHPPRPPRPCTSWSWCTRCWVCPASCATSCGSIWPAKMMVV